MPVPCARCDSPLPLWELASADAAVCTSCGSRNTVRVFPALFAAPSAPALPESALDGEAACFDHPVQTRRGGLPPVRPIRVPAVLRGIRRQGLVPFLRRRRQGQSKAIRLEPSRMLYDSIALAVPLVSLICSGRITLITGAGTLVFSAMTWRRPLSLVRRSRWRFVVAMLVALARDRGLALAPRLLVAAVQDGEIWRHPGKPIAGCPAAAAAQVARASMWMGSDHLLLVKSAWFREEYKRFYLRDIQAIVVAPCARFFVSTPMLVCAFLWLVPVVTVGVLAGRPRCGVGGSHAGHGGHLDRHFGRFQLPVPALHRGQPRRPAIALPHLDRAQVPRQVKPRIDQVQGVVDAGWAEAERSNTGPAAAALAPVGRGRVPPRASHTVASDLFVLSLFVGSLVGLATAHSELPGSGFRVNTGLTLAQLAGAIAVLIEYYRGGVGRATQKLAVSALVLIGVAFYMQTFAFSFANAGQGFALNSAAMAMSGPGKVVHQVTDGLGLLLGFVGAAIILRGGPDIIKD